MAINVGQILDTIRDNASQAYQDRVPAYNRDNLHQVGKAITANSNIMNEFLEMLVNRIAFTNIKTINFSNPFKKLKGQDIPMGSTIQEIYVNPAIDRGWDTDGNLLLKQTTPDGKACYYSINRKSTYPVSISAVDLEQAFTSEDKFVEQYNVIVQSLSGGDEIDEFLLCKNLLGQAIDNESIELITDLDIEVDTKEVAKSISLMSQSFTFPSTKFAGYNKVNASAISSGEKPAITACPKQDQVLFITAKAMTEINFEVLATMFHMELAQLEAMTILVDEIPSETHEVYAVLMDKSAFQMRDKVYRIESMSNGSNLTTNFWLHHWQAMYISMFGNAIAFGKTK